MPIGPQYPITSTPCPNCHKSMDLANEVNGTRSPEKNDICVCLYCGNLNVFNDDLTLRPLGYEEYNGLTENLKQHIQKTLGIIELIDMVRKRAND